MSCFCPSTLQISVHLKEGQGIDGLATLKNKPQLHSLVAKQLCQNISGKNTIIFTGPSITSLSLFSEFSKQGAQTSGYCFCCSASVFMLPQPPLSSSCPHFLLWCTDRNLSLLLISLHFCIFYFFIYFLLWYADSVLRLNSTERKTVCCVPASNEISQHYSVQLQWFILSSSSPQTQSETSLTPNRTDSLCQWKHEAVCLYVTPNWCDISSWYKSMCFVFCCEIVLVYWFTKLNIHAHDQRGRLRQKKWHLYGQI